MNEITASDHARALGRNMDLAVRAANAAGELIRSGYGNLAVIEQKGVGDLVSQLDRDADLAATRVLRSESDCPILSEELNNEVGDCSSMWIVDPLDGSSAFLMQAGTQYPSVLIARRDRHETTVGVVYFPLTNDWYYAQKGRGAWRNGKRLICAAPPPLADVWVELNHYGNAQWETAFFIELRDRLRSSDGAQLVTSSVPHSGVAMRIATADSSLAAAVHDNDGRNAKQGPWDIAAPQVILEEAGGVFISPNGERTDPFAGEPVIVARSAELAKEIIGLVARQPAGS